MFQKNMRMFLGKHPHVFLFADTGDIFRPKTKAAFVGETMAPHGQTTAVQAVAEPRFDIIGKRHGLLHRRVAEVLRHQSPEDILVMALGDVIAYDIPVLPACPAEGRHPAQA